MTLSKHINAEKIERKYLAQSGKTELTEHEEFISKYQSNVAVPKYEIPLKSSNSSLVYKYLKEELALDGNTTLNLASFVNTQVDETPLKLISENLVKNLADNDEYPTLLEYQQRCISILSNLWHAPSKLDAGTQTHVATTVGTATTGSSEAILLGGLAMKKKWQEKRIAENKSISSPNILMASCAQVALEKFARYFDVENRTIRITEKSHHLIDTDEIKKNIDENTIGIFVILGSTFTGAFEPVEKISKILDEIEKERGLDIKIHVDGASGGFVAPFIFPHLRWDFEVDRVISINTSGHKFGLTTAGLGWIIWRDLEYLPESLRFKLDYLGGVEETFNLNFSRPGFPVIHQYYNFLTYGHEGYTKIFNSAVQNARLLSNILQDSTFFEVLSVIHRKIPSVEERSRIYTRSHDINHSHKDESTRNENFYPGLPVVAFRFSKEFRSKFPEIPQSIVSLLLRNKGFIVPNYHLTPDEQDKEILRVVVREDFGLNLLEKLSSDIIATVELLVRSTETVRSAVEAKNTGEKVDKKVIYDLLLSIVSNGATDVKDLQTIELDKEGTGHHKHKRSYRGAC